MRREVGGVMKITGPQFGFPKHPFGTGTYEVPSRAVIRAVTGTTNITGSSETISVIITYCFWMNAQAQNRRFKGGTRIWIFPIPRTAAVEGKEKDFLTAVPGTQGPWLQWKS